MKRKEFIRLAAPAVFLLANGKISRATGYFLSAEHQKKIKFRFAVASDGHYGEEGTDYANYFSTVVSAINAEHSRSPFAFGVINGDIVHNNKDFYPPAKAALDNLSFKYYVSQGNHDHVTAAEWEGIWNIPVNTDFIAHDHAFLIGTTSNEKGDYLCPDVAWFEKKLEEHRKKTIFIFVHINPCGLTDNAVTCAPLLELFAKHKNIRAVFNGHDHDLEGIKMKNEIPYIFDAHFGGSWGTSYRGFRVVEVLKDGSVATFIMNPGEMINKTVI